MFKTILIYWFFVIDFITDIFITDIIACGQSIVGGKLNLGFTITTMWVSGFNFHACNHNRYSIMHGSLLSVLP